MIHFVRENMAPLMFGGMIIFMLIGYPAAFSLAATGLFFGFIGIELGLITPDFLGNLTYQLFGVISNAVTRRRHEMAVRLALGADHGRILRLMLGEGALLVGIGVLLGIPGLYAASGLIRGALIGISPSDPLTLASVALGLGLVTLAACYLPARRVLGIDPAQSLRQE